MRPGPGLDPAAALPSRTAPRLTALLVEPGIVTLERERLQVDRFGPVDCAKLAENGVVIATIGSLDMA